MLGWLIETGVLTTLYRQAELQASDQAFELLRVPPLIGANEAFDRHASCVGQRQ